MFMGSEPGVIQQAVLAKNGGAVSYSGCLIVLAGMLICCILNKYGDVEQKSWTIAVG